MPELITDTLSLFNYLKEVEKQSRPVADCENGPSERDIYFPPTTKEIWKCAYSESRKVANGHQAFCPHPEEMKHCKPY